MDVIAPKAYVPKSRIVTFESPQFKLVAPHIVIYLKHMGVIGALKIMSR